MIPLQSRRRSPQLDRKDRGEVDHAAEQATQRDRRRKHLDVTYGEHFDLLVEVHDIAQPLAHRVASEPSPLAYAVDVADLADAVHKVVVVVFDLVTLADARRRTAHLKPQERDRAVAALRELADRPQPPEVTDSMLSSGTWVAVLCEHAGSHAGKLSDLLGRAAAPGTRRGLLSVSEQLVEALREVDRAAISLTCHLDKAAFDRRALRRVPKTGRPDPLAELARLGVVLADGERERTSP